MEDSYVQLNELPDEILMIIFKKLTNVEILYSLSDVNKRLHKIVHDSIFTNHLSLMMSTRDSLVHSLPDSILDQFCSHILPKIHQKVKWLDLESRSMERILLTTNYPNLYGIRLHNISAQTAIDLFTNETSVLRILKNQILSFTINTNTQGLQGPPGPHALQDIRGNHNAIIFNHIFTIFTNLQYLNFNGSLNCDERLNFWLTRPTVLSTNLFELHVSLRSFYDCLYLLDGHFNQLRTLYVEISTILSSDIRVNKTEKLPKLKCFWLHCKRRTVDYDELVVPLLCRMSNLEKLDLYITVGERKTFFDGNDFKTNIINHMPQLNKFTFNVHSYSSFYNENNLPSNEDIQKTFMNFNDKQIIYWADYFPQEKVGHCHIYSYPYKLKYYHMITNNFPGGIFGYVRKVSLFDERPFEHEFFLQITQSFPLMEDLSVRNQQRQINKRFRKSDSINPHLSIIKYPSLKQLDLINASIDYYEQFLFDTKTCLPFDVHVHMYYRLVKQVTHNFTGSRTRSNCAKINYANLFIGIKIIGDPVNFFAETKEVSERIKNYFPRTQIKCTDNC